MDRGEAFGVLFLGMILVAGIIIYLISDNLCVCGVPLLVVILGIPMIKIITKSLPKIMK